MVKTSYFDRYSTDWFTELIILGLLLAIDNVTIISGIVELQFGLIQARREFKKVPRQLDES